MTQGVQRVKVVPESSTITAKFFSVGKGDFKLKSDGRIELIFGENFVFHGNFLKKLANGRPSVSQKPP